MRTQVLRTEKLGIVGVITPRQEEGQIQGREMMDYPEGSRMPYLGVAWGEFLRTKYNRPSSQSQFAVAHSETLMIDPGCGFQDGVS